MDTPVIVTPRLRLRSHTPDDFEAAAALWGDPEVTRFIGGEPRPPSEVWDRLFTKAGQWRLLGYGYWLVERRDDGTSIGEAGFVLKKRAFDPAPKDGWPASPEIGWAFRPQAQGQGFALEAASACIDWLDAQGIDHTLCLIDSGNAASLKLAAKLGYAAYDTAGMGGRAMTLLERRRPA